MTRSAEGELLEIHSLRIALARAAMMVVVVTMMMMMMMTHPCSLSRQPTNRQWDLLTEFAKGQNATELVLDCAWKIGDWNSMRDALARYAGAASDTPQLKY